MSASCLIIAGEKSGEEHCLSFFPRLKELMPEVNFFGVGGNEMKSLGVEIIFHLNEFSSWGVSEVIGKIPFYLQAGKKLEEECLKRDTKYAILIDFQTFNLKLAQRLHRAGIKVFYYVAPQAWAWKAYRTKSLAKFVHTLFTILPFEKKWFLDREVKQVVSVPHPLYHKYKDSVSSYQRSRHMPEIKQLLLLPGSRNFEVKNLMPEFMAASIELKKKYKIKLGIVLSSSIDRALVEPYLGEISREFSDKELEDALKWGHLAFAASGTVTLSAAIFALPALVAYKSSLLNEFIFQTFVTYRGPISLCNIIHQKFLYPEFIQDQVSVHNLNKWASDLIDQEDFYKGLVDELSLTHSKLSGEVQDVALYLKEIMRGERE
jgi:lipid-A-disaccharide synthase